LAPYLRARVRWWRGGAAPRLLAVAKGAACPDMFMCMCMCMCTFGINSQFQGLWSTVTRQAYNLREQLCRYNFVKGRHVRGYVQVCIKRMYSFIHSYTCMHRKGMRPFQQAACPNPLWVPCCAFSTRSIAQSCEFEWVSVSVYMCVTHRMVSRDMPLHAPLIQQMFVLWLLLHLYGVCPAVDICACVPDHYSTWIFKLELGTTYGIKHASYQARTSYLFSWQIFHHTQANTRNQTLEMTSLRHIKFWQKLVEVYFLVRKSTMNSTFCSSHDILLQSRPDKIFMAVVNGMRILHAPTHKDTHTHINRCTKRIEASNTES
jgi:hypothetical protein